MNFRFLLNKILLAKINYLDFYFLSIFSFNLKKIVKNKNTSICKIDLHDFVEFS
jgi:hypothetical protein